MRCAAPAPAARGQGIGRAVLEQLQLRARALGIVALHLEVARSNGRARRLYAAYGFEARDRYALMTCRLSPVAVRRWHPLIAGGELRMARPDTP
ncbi:MAG: GNAT family N-acetyltransferase [Gammaproteobacteria bacterium]|nr:GNAT family N-acetyltransferase [Gammaproteobacteria bacterium]